MLEELPPLVLLQVTLLIFSQVSSQLSFASTSAPTESSAQHRYRSQPLVLSQEQLISYLENQRNYLQKQIALRQDLPSEVTEKKFESQVDTTGAEEKDDRIEQLRIYLRDILDAVQIIVEDVERDRITPTQGIGLIIPYLSEFEMMIDFWWDNYVAMEILNLAIQVVLESIVAILEHGPVDEELLRELVSIIARITRLFHQYYGIVE